MLIQFTIEVSKWKIGAEFVDGTQHHTKKMKMSTTLINKEFLPIQTSTPNDSLSNSTFKN